MRCQTRRESVPHGDLVDPTEDHHALIPYPNSTTSQDDPGFATASLTVSRARHGWTWGGRKTNRALLSIDAVVSTQRIAVSTTNVGVVQAFPRGSVLIRSCNVQTSAPFTKSRISPRYSAANAFVLGALCRTTSAWIPGRVPCLLSRDSRLDRDRVHPCCRGSPGGCCRVPRDIENVPVMTRDDVTTETTATPQ